MKILKVFLILIASIIFLFFVVGVFLPSSYSVNKSIPINASNSVIYQNIVDFKNFNKWNPWLKAEPNTPMVYKGAPGVPGHDCYWLGKKTGEGVMTLNHVELNKMANIDLKFIKPMESLATMNFEITSEGTSNKVTWTMSGECDSIMDKWMGVMVKILLKSDFEKGLNELKALSEAAS